jgi:lipoprotein-anchoring transpeptidase ErfK/SrfK
MLKAEIHHESASHPYTWITVSEGSPETLQVHRVGGVVFSTPVNTGVPGAETPQGVFPIFTHVPTSDMKGTNPDGTKYDDPNVPWDSYFNGGDAVHGFPRASYGSPQSNGCVELPVPAAERVYGMVDVGDLVVVTA